MAKKKRPKRLEKTPSDFGPPEPIARGERVNDSNRTGNEAGSRARIENRLDWYLTRGFINSRQHEAGMWFRTNWILATQLPRLIGRYNRAAGGIEILAERQLDAKTRVNEALGLMAAESRDAVVQVAGMDDWAGKDNVRHLQAGLDIIASVQKL